MFDTLALRCSIPAISKTHLDTIAWGRTGTNINHNNIADHTSTFKTLRRKNNSSGIPYILYSLSDKDASTAFIKVEVSIPKFLYNNNVDELKDADIDLFCKKLRRYVAKHLNLPIKSIPPIQTWTVLKLHACKNFDVGEHVQEYLQHYSNLSRSKYKRQSYYKKGSNAVETVVWSAKTRKEKIYDKYSEVKQRSRDMHQLNTLKKAVGILRYEVELSAKELYRQSNGKRLVRDLLNPQVAHHILNKGLLDLQRQHVILASDSKKIHQKIRAAGLPKRQESSLIAFAYELEEYGEAETRMNEPKSSFKRKNALLKKILKQSKNDDKPLPHLTLEHDSIFDFDEQEILWED
ncbi:phage/plasmid replication domain-containing protein [Saccharibacillus sacchari]|uniref:phage/plasmid replication domain-containing protein n=1 Tax=Saccharibacillus sacchari TaxID=456493 RepID=UPI0004BC329F|nr:phage/plasmid replication protein [Saccharibacillus sacchari]